MYEKKIGVVVTVFGYFIFFPMYVNPVISYVEKMKIIPLFLVSVHFILRKKIGYFLFR